MSSANNAKKCAYYGAMLALAMICGYIESLIPFDFGMPGIKLGIANIVALFILYKNGFVQSFVINTARILLCGILFGNALSIVYSLCGGTLAVLIMWAVSKTKHFSPIGASVAGAAAHGVGQLAAAAVVIGFNAALFYLPVLLIAGVVTGTLTGIAAVLALKRVHAFDRLMK